MIHVIDNSNREWADAPDLENAIFAMKHISDEEHCDLRAVDENGKVLAWCFKPTADDHHVIQTSSAYALDDPKHETYHEHMSDIWDNREGK